jgi:hypothetical protein
MRSEPCAEVIGPAFEGAHLPRGSIEKVPGVLCRIRDAETERGARLDNDDRELLAGKEGELRDEDPAGRAASYNDHILYRNHLLWSVPTDILAFRSDLPGLLIPFRHGPAGVPMAT